MRRPTHRQVFGEASSYRVIMFAAAKVDAKTLVVWGAGVKAKTKNVHIWEPELVSVSISQKTGVLGISPCISLLSHKRSPKHTTETSALRNRKSSAAKKTPPDTPTASHPEELREALPEQRQRPRAGASAPCLPTGRPRRPRFRHRNVLPAAPTRFAAAR